MNKCYLLALSAILFCFSCKKKTGDQGPQGPSGTLYKGSIKGFLSVYDQYGNRRYNGLQNIRVTLQGGSGAVAYTDSAGLFMFDSVVSGNYSIAIAGDSIASKVVNNVNFIKDTLFEEIPVSQVPTFQIPAIHVNVSTGNHYVSIGLLPNEPSHTRSVIVFADTNPQVSNTIHKLDTVITIPAGSTGRLFYISSDNLNKAGIFYGDTVYFAAYPYSFNNYSLYEDANTGKMVYTAIGTPALDTIVSP